MCPDPADSLRPCEPGMPGGCRASVGRLWRLARRGLPLRWCWFYIYAQARERGRARGAVYPRIPLLRGRRVGPPDPAHAVEAELVGERPRQLELQPGSLRAAVDKVRQRTPAVERQVDLGAA